MTSETSSRKKETLIASPENEKFKFLSHLTLGKTLKKEDYFFLSGEKLIREFLREKPKGWEIHAEVGIAGSATRAQTAALSFAPLWLLTPDLFHLVDVLKTNFNLLVLKKKELPLADLKKPPQGVEVILPLGDPGNLGAVLRSCEAFAVSRVILTSEAAQVFLPKAVKASAGSLFRLPLFRGPSFQELSRAAGPLIALDAKGQNLRQFSWPKNFRLILGEEGPGLGALKVQHRLAIPTQGVESLNAVVAASIALFSSTAK